MAVTAAILLFVSVPVILTARSQNRPTVGIGFVAACLIVGGGVGFLDARYQRAYEVCTQEGRGSCVDYGFTGFQALILVGFLVGSMVMTYRIFND